MSDRTATLDALDELAEVFTGLSHELEWSTSEEISKKELLPIFHMVANGILNPEQGLEVVMSNVRVKRDETFDVLLKIVQRLNRQLSDFDLTPRESVQEETNNGFSGEEPV